MENSAQENDSLWIVNKKSTNNSTNNKYEFTIRDVAKILFSHTKDIILITLLVMSGVAFTVFWLMSPTYETKARIHIDVQSGAMPVMRSPGMFVSDAEKLGYFETVIQELKNPGVLENVVTKLNLGKNRTIGNIERIKNKLKTVKQYIGKVLKIKKWQKPIDMVAQALSAVDANYKVNRLANSTILELVYDSKNPVECKNTLDALITEYLNYRDTFLHDKAIGTSQFLQGQIDSIQSKIEEVENKLMKLIDGDIMKLELGNDGEWTAVKGMATTPRAIEEIKLHILSMKEQRDNLLAKYTANHPVIKRLDKTIEAYAKVVNMAPRHQVKIQRLKRILDTQEALLKQMTLARDNAVVFESRDLKKLKAVKVIKEAGLPASPIAPKKVLAMVASVFLGLLLGFVYSFIVDFLDRTIKSPNDVINDIGIDCISSIPKIK